MNNFEKTVQLPSNGLFGGPKEITLRAMTTKEEKILMTTRDFSLFERLIVSCCVEPKDLDIGLLHQNDIFYLIYALRNLTFGDTYEQEMECPECGVKSPIEVHISELETIILDTDKIEERMTVTLPVNNDTIALRFLSLGDIKRIDKQVKIKSQKGKLRDAETYSFITKLMETIVSRNGEDFESEADKRNYVETLHMRDINAIQKCLSDIEFGLDNTIMATCDSCGEEVETRAIIAPEFFRPSK